jgi:hypothetical protein
VSDENVYLNGINALTGEYLVPPLTPQAVADKLTAAPRAEGPLGWFRGLVKKLTGGRAFALPLDVDPTDPVQSGWGVVFPAGTPEAVRAGLRPLLDRRARQVGALYKELEYRPGEDRDQWLARYGAQGSDVEPTRVPYYLLLVGHPHEIPFEFQYHLDVDYAVGRLAFDDPAGYGRYADALVAYEGGATVAVAREVVYWGTRHPMDTATQLSADHLVTPLAEGEPAQGPTPAREPVTARYGYTTRVLKAADATKAHLRDVLGARERPALLFTASHGMGGWPKGDPRQLDGQGALLCQDWRGFGQVAPEHYLTGAELAGTDLRGTVAFVFACYGAGTPRHDNFLEAPGAGARELAERPFVSALVQRLLAGGALAVVGHIDRAWGYSIRPPKVGPQLLPFRNLIGRVLGGEPVGHSTLDFSQRYATASVSLANLLAPHQPGSKLPADPALVRLWVARNDAQNYVVLGDPAARLRDARRAAPAGGV